MGQWGVFLYVCGADERPFYCYVCGREQTGEEERDENEARRLRKTDKFTGRHSSSEGVTDGEKLDPASAYNQFSDKLFFHSALPQQPTSIVFFGEGKAGNEAVTHFASI